MTCVACGILVPRPGVEPVPAAVEVRSLNHWTAREVPSPILKAKFNWCVLLLEEKIDMCSK